MPIEDALRNLLESPQTFDRQCGGKMKKKDKLKVTYEYEEVPDNEKILEEIFGFLLEPEKK